MPAPTVPRRPTVQERSRPLPRPPSLHAELQAPALVRLCRSRSTSPRDILGAIRTPEGFEAINATDATGRTALHWAVDTVNPPVVEVLLSLGAHPDLPDHRGETPLHLCAWYGNARSRAALATIDALMDHRADPEALNHDGYSPLSIATRLEATAVLERLTVARDLEALMARFTTESRPEQFAVTVQRCLAQGVDPNGRNASSHRSWLAELAGRRAVDLVGHLLALGADPRANEPQGLSALHRAVAAGDAPMVEILLAAGAVVDGVDDQGRSPFWLAIDRGHPTIAQRLLDAGADPTRTSGTGVSPWQQMLNQDRDDPLYATARGRVEAVLAPALVAWERAQLRQSLPDGGLVAPRPGRRL